MNQALLAKMGWRLQQGDSGMWSDLLKHKYLNNHTIFKANLKKGVISSGIWKGIIFGAKLLQTGSRWRVGTGDRIRFWTDLWVPEVGQLKDHARGAISMEDLQQPVRHYMTSDGWNLEQLMAVLPECVVLKIYGLKLALLRVVKIS